MVLYCCAYGCKQTWIKGGGVTFHSFPKDEERKKEWEVQLRRENFKATKYSRICSKHFSEESFDRTKFGGTWLKPDALPTIFNFPQHLQKTVKKRKPVKRLSPESSDTDLRGVPGPSGVKKKRLHYVGDFSDEDVASPTKAIKFLHLVKDQTSSYQKKIKSLTKKNELLKKKITSLEEMLDELKQNNLISDTASSVLGVSTSGPATEFINRLRDTKSRDAYPSDLKAFALTLNFYSAKAYNYVRNTFQCNLPHPSTLRRWYRCVDGSPGFTSEAFAALKLKADEAAKKNQTVYCGLIMDEMSIRKHVEWDKTKFSGYIDLGTEVDDDQLPYAKEALVFLLNSLNGNWKVPVAYFLIDGLSGAEKANLVREALHCIHETGVKVVSLTFDGCSSNISAANCLGARLSPDRLQHYFPHPVTNENVYVILDPCHMLKLIRNCLATKGSISDGKGGLIRWQHIVDLEKLQSEEGLHAATKLRSRHIEWTREKMKVKLAAQVISRSVADALTYLSSDMKHPLFLNCSPTVEFLMKFNDLFDILNSKNLLSKGFKSPLQSKNKDRVFNFFNDVEMYIKNLKTALNGESILYTNRKTGFLGFLICINSIKSLYNLLIDDVNIKFLLTYKLSQDHLELFFSAVRSKGGHNNNPTSKQFKSAYVRLLIHHQIMTSDSANCLVLDSTNLVNVTNAKNRYLESINGSGDSEFCSLDDDEQTLNDNFKTLSAFVSDVVSYIAGFVARKLSKSLKCEICRESLHARDFQDKLSIRKNRGGLFAPSTNVIRICRIGEKVFRAAQAMGKLQKRNLMHALIANSLREALEKNFTIFENLDEHSKEQGVFDNHKVFLIKAILFEYLKVRLCHSGKIITSKLQGLKVRSINIKNTLFSGQ